MFWKTDYYDAPATAEPIETLLTNFVSANDFDLFKESEPNLFVLKHSSNSPSLSNLFVIKLFVESSSSGRKIKVEVMPKTWLLVAMVLLVILAVIAFKFDFALRRIVGLSFPLLFATPYMYALISIQKLLELKGHLIPGYLDTKEGRLEMQQRNFSPLKLVLNFQQYAYISFVVVFILVMLLWMTGVIESLNPADWFKK